MQCLLRTAGVRALFFYFTSGGGGKKRQKKVDEKIETLEEEMNGFHE